MERPTSSTFEILVIAVAGVAAALVAIVSLGASLATLSAANPTWVSLDATVDAIPRLPDHLGDPSSAWPVPYAANLPGPVRYWTTTLLVGGAFVTTAVAAWRRWGNRRVGTTRRRPLGVDARPDFARPGDLRTLIVPRPTPGRFILGRHRLRLLATEAPATAEEAGNRRIHARRGDRGAVALIGPSRSGKTTAAIGGILEWEGPAILSSVKADLLGSTLHWRTQCGGVQVFDPTTSVPSARKTSARWSPIAQAASTPGAQRAARALCDAAPKNGVEGGMDFWLAQAEILLASLLFVAHHTGQDMGALAGWVLTQDRPTDMGAGEVRAALDALLSTDNPVVAVDAVDASRGLLGIWDMEERTRSSVYATAQTVIWPWSDPGVAASSRGRSIDLAWLLADTNTVYLCSPIEDQRRLAPAFGGLLNDLINQAYRRVAATGRPIDPPLLIVIDEAGNTPLRGLPEYASTLAGLGILLVTIWQSLAQIESAYGKAADTILSNCLSKVIYAGTSCPSTLRYVTQVLGDAEVETRSHSDSRGYGPGSDQWSTTRGPLAPAHVLRQMVPGDALLVHGTLPPAHITTRPFYREPELADRAGLLGRGGAAA